MRSTTLALSLALAGLMPLTTHAALQTAANTTVTNLRIEGAYGFIGLAQAMPAPCNARAWVDLNTPQGRAIYATALVAFNGKQTVTVRARDEAQYQAYGSCGLYDIYVAQ